MYYLILASLALFFEAALCITFKSALRSSLNLTRTPADTWKTVDIEYFGPHSVPDYRVRRQDDQGNDVPTIRRPEWVKNLKCTGATPDTCVECTGTESCWTSVDNGYGVSLEDGAWSRSVFKAHVSCEAEYVKMYINIRHVKGGTLSVYWDGDEVKRNGDADVVLTSSSIDSPVVPSDISTADYYTRFHFTAYPEKGEPHVLSIEFTRNPASTENSVDLKMHFGVPGTFVYCEDTLACIQTLAEDDEGLSLKNSNFAQFKCLKGTEEGKSDACKRWRTCLESSGTMAGVKTNKAIRQLVKAGQNKWSGGAAATSTSGAVAQQPQCMDPDVEDPESWFCDCFESMKKTCGRLYWKANFNFKRRQCFTALFCLSDNVCESWKSDMCQANKIKKIKDLATQTRSAYLTQTGLASSSTRLALSARTKANDNTSGDSTQLESDLDNMLWSKSCQ